MKSLKQLPTQARLHELFTYDNGLLKWNINIATHIPKGTIAGTKMKKGYIRIKVDGEYYVAHRLIWVYHHNHIDGDIQIDHINQIKDDNRIENLRLATNSTNQYNKPISNKNKSGVIGVWHDEKASKWIAYIWKDNKEIRLGSFYNKTDAIIARLQAEVKYCGELAPQKHLFAEYCISLITIK